MSEPTVKPPEAGKIDLRRNRLITGITLLVLFEVWPIIGLCVAARESNATGLALAFLFMAFGTLPPIGVWLGQRWAYMWAQYVSGAGVIAILVDALSKGFSPIHLIFGPLYAGLFIVTNLSRPSRETAIEESKPDNFGQWIKENIEAIVVAFIMALVIRCFCIEVFKIPSSSMEPTLLGDLNAQHPRDGCPFGKYHVDPGGDRIMVSKFYYAMSPVERFDVVVFKFPLNQSRNFIKRVVGLPGERLLISGGNLYVKPKGENRFRIAKRSPRTQDSIWINAADQKSFLEKRELFDEYWEAVPAAGARSAAYDVRSEELVTQEARGVRFRYKPPIDDGSHNKIGELRIALDFEITGGKGQVFAEIVNEFGRFEARLGTDETGELRFHAPGNEKSQPTTTIPLRSAKLSLDRRYRLDLAVFDGTVYVRLNGNLQAEYPFIVYREDVRANADPNRSVSFGARDVTLRVRNLSLGRDIYYRGRDSMPYGRSHSLLDETEVTIPENKYMVLGDNVNNSHDSRAWTKFAYKVEGRAEPIKCEAQEAVDPDQNQNLSSSFLDEIQKKYDLPARPDVAIKADEYGNEWALYNNPKDLQGVKPGSPVAVLQNRLEPEPDRFIDRKFIVGKAFWIWWPAGRWFHLIR